MSFSSVSGVSSVFLLLMTLHFSSCHTKSDYYISHRPPESHLNLLEVFECSDAPDQPEETDEGPGHAHVVEALGDCLALAPGHLAAVRCHCAIAVILLPGGVHSVVGGDMKRGTQCGLRVRDTNPKTEYDKMKLDGGSIRSSPRFGLGKVEIH